MRIIIAHGSQCSHGSQHSSLLPTADRHLQAPFEVQKLALVMLLQTASTASPSTSPHKAGSRTACCTITDQQGVVSLWPRLLAAWQGMHSSLWHRYCASEACWLLKAVLITVTHAAQKELNFSLKADHQAFHIRAVTLNLHVLDSRHKDRKESCRFCQAGWHAWEA